MDCCAVALLSDFETATGLDLRGQPALPACGATPSLSAEHRMLPACSGDRSPHDALSFVYLVLPDKSNILWHLKFQVDTKFKPYCFPGEQTHISSYERKYTK